jgi:hypothetical protein
MFTSPASDSVNAPEGFLSVVSSAVFVHCIHRTLALLKWQWLSAIEEIGDVNWILWDTDQMLLCYLHKRN